MGDISPMSRDEKLLRRILGQSIETEPPQSRIEFLLQEIIDGGGIGTGSYKIKDQYATLAELEAAHPVGEDGDAYLVGDPTHIYVWLDDRQEYADGGLFAAVPGLDGVGITSIEKTATAGLVDTYTITYTDGDTDTFTVTNGAQGEPGEDGDDGVGITSIAKSGTVGNVDTYTITLTDGSTYNFTVTNGESIGVPEGGTTGQVLVKKSNTDYDTEWANAGAGEGVPAGGTTGQILAKKTGADYDTEWVDNEGGSDVTSEIESLSAAASELASETGSLSTENSTQTSEINSLSSEYNSLSSKISSNTSDISSLSQSMSELASAAASQSTSQSQIDSTQDVALASLSTENSTQTSEIGSMASEMASMSVSDITSQLSSLSTENSTQESEIGSLAATDSTHTSELSSLSQSMSEIASAASSTSTAQSELDSEQDSSLASLSTENSTAASELASLSTENSTQTSEIDSLSTAASEMGSELDVIGSEVAEKQDVLTAGSGIDITGDVISIDTDIYVDTPLGTIIPYGGTVAPTGFLVCDGSAVSRTTYAQLFAVIGTKYGEGDGSTTFNLPDAEAGTIVYPSNEVNGIAGSIYIIKATTTALPSDFSAILTANNNLFQAAYQNGQYGFVVDGTFYAIGGGGGGGSTVGCVKYDENFTGLTVEEFAHLGISQS